MLKRSVVALLLLTGVTVESCTTLVVGKAATVDGSVISSHSNDGAGDAIGNFRHVKAENWPAGSIRPPGIPQVNHTYAYHTEGYAAMNEFQVGLAESTCSSVYVGESTALLNIVDLSQIGLERGTTAETTITVMGNLAVQHGFYGWGGKPGSGESLLVTDPHTAYIFHVLPDSTGTSAIWAAQRVPDDHIGVVANTFTIRDMDLTSGMFLFSKNIQAEAALRGWNASLPLDFTLYFSDGEDGHKYYTGRRMWAAYKMLASKQNLSPDYGNFVQDKPYPATVKPDAKVDIQDLMRVMRYQYEGTPYDLTVGLAAGPFGTPSRWAGAPANVTGWWERAIGIYKTIVSYVTQSRSWLPNEIGGVVWFAPHAAHTSCYVPFPVGMDTIPIAYNSSTGTLDRTKAFWVHRILLNVAQIKYQYMIVDIKEMQAFSEGNSLSLQKELDATYLKNHDMGQVTAAFTQNANNIVKNFSQLSDTLIQHYPDGYCNGCGHGLPHVLGYPAWWLESVGYQNTTAADTLRTMNKCVDSCPEDSVGSYKACVKACL
eukprot:TRINITY_DN37975_c0_g1_i1.p1 TRINITY_DN37975_c0_g1~~TRINITY_DN37975_c0_g1_i1.p1  ORF type:complete len:558 (+),score=110.93 TRINITY_DN37975_c0_g1_i1:50-1675(+)